MTSFAEVQAARSTTFGWEPGFVGGTTRVGEIVAYTSGVVLSQINPLVSYPRFKGIEKRFLFVSFSKIRIVAWLDSPTMGVSTGFGKSQDLVRF